MTAAVLVVGGVTALAAATAGRASPTDTSPPAGADSPAGSPAPAAPRPAQRPSSSGDDGQIALVGDDGQAPHVLPVGIRPPPPPAPSPPLYLGWLVSATATTAFPALGAPPSWWSSSADPGGGGPAPRRARRDRPCVQPLPRRLRSCPRQRARRTTSCASAAARGRDRRRPAGRRADRRRRRPDGRARRCVASATTATSRRCAPDAAAPSAAVRRPGGDRDARRRRRAPAARPRSVPRPRRDGEGPRRRPRRRRRRARRPGRRAREPRRRHRDRRARRRRRLAGPRHRRPPRRRRRAGAAIALARRRPGDVEHDRPAVARAGPSITSSTRDRRAGRAGWRTVSVAAASCVDANTASTAAIVRGRAGRRLARALGLPARLVDADGAVVHRRRLAERRARDSRPPEPALVPRARGTGARHARPADARASSSASPGVRAGAAAAGLPRFAVDVAAPKPVAARRRAARRPHRHDACSTRSRHLRSLDAVVPFASAYRPLWLGLGAIAIDLLIALVVTSLVRARLGLRAWRGVHWCRYACWPVALLHGLGTGTDARTPWMQALTAVCVAVVPPPSRRLAAPGSTRTPRRAAAGCSRCSRGARVRRPGPAEPVGAPRRDARRAPRLRVECTVRDGRAARHARPRSRHGPVRRILAGRAERRIATGAELRILADRRPGAPLHLDMRSSAARSTAAASRCPRAGSPSAPDGAAPSYRRRIVALQAVGSRPDSPGRAPIRAPDGTCN